MTAFRQDDADSPRTNARPRRTLRGRLQQQIARERRQWRERRFASLFCWLVLLPLGGLGSYWVHVHYPGVMGVIALVYFAVLLIHHWWSNRGAE